MIPLWVSIYGVAGLDFRLGWTASYTTWIQFAGSFFFILGNALVSWAMVANH